MPTFYDARVIDVAPTRARIRLTVRSPEARRFWSSRGFALLLLLERFIHDEALEKKGTIFGFIPPDLVSADHLVAIRDAAKRIVKSCKLTDISGSFPEHLARVETMPAESVGAYFAEAAELPAVTVVIGLKEPGAADHLTPGLSWESAAFDIEDARSGVG
jgi:hypothetical protein